MSLKDYEKHLEDFTTLLLQTHYEDYNKRVSDFKWNTGYGGFLNEEGTRPASDKDTILSINKTIKRNKEKIKYYEKML